MQLTKNDLKDEIILRANDLEKVLGVTIVPADATLTYTLEDGTTPS